MDTVHAASRTFAYSVVNTVLLGHPEEFSDPEREESVIVRLESEAH